MQMKLLCISLPSGGLPEVIQVDLIPVYQVGNLWVYNITHLNTGEGQIRQSCYKETDSHR